MIISISGLPGSGKTSVGKLVAKKLGFKFYSMGDFRGKMAKERGLTIDELNKIGKKEFWTDRKADEYQKKLGREEDNFVIDGWLSFYFIPKSVKIFLDVDMNLAAKRIFKDQREDEKKGESPEETLGMIKNRVKETDERYKKYYGVDFLDKKHYDLVIDTTNLKMEEVVQKILDFLKK